MGFSELEIVTNLLGPYHSLRLHKTIETRFPEFLQRLLGLSLGSSKRQVQDRGPNWPVFTIFSSPLLDRVIPLGHGFDYKVRCETIKLSHGPASSRSVPRLNPVL